MQLYVKTIDLLPQCARKHIRRKRVEHFKNKDLLEMHPVSVTRDYRLMDGAQRVLAAHEMDMEYIPVRIVTHV